MKIQPRGGLDQIVTTLCGSSANGQFLGHWVFLLFVFFFCLRLGWLAELCIFYLCVYVGGCPIQTENAFKASQPFTQERNQLSSFPTSGKTKRTIRIKVQTYRRLLTKTLSGPNFPSPSSVFFLAFRDLFSLFLFFFQLGGVHGLPSARASVACG